MAKKVLTNDSVEWQVEGGHQVSTQRARLDGREWLVITTWTTEGLRPEPISVKVTTSDPRAAPVIADVIRRLPIGGLQQAARRSGDENAAGWRNRALAFQHPPGPPSYQRRSVLLDHATRLGAMSEGAGGHRGVVSSRDELAQVALIYGAKSGRGREYSVTKAVATHFGISESTAAKRIMRARSAGLLEPATKHTRQVQED